MLTRRSLLSFILPAATTLALPERLLSALSNRPALSAFEAHLAQLEPPTGGRLGVAVLDTRTNTLAGHRLHERFPMCSTSKAVIVAAVLARVDQHKEHLDRIVRYTRQQLLSYSPVTAKHVAEGLSVRDLCAAAVTLSDNTAANLLLASIGGPAGFTAYVRTLGDTFTRLDRNEPSLNQAIPGDPRDTTTPAAMASDLRTLLLGHALSPASTAQLTGWMLACQTGLERLRSGLSPDWKVADKTGTGDHGTANDIAAIWPPHPTPLLVTAYLTETTVPAAQLNQTFAAIARAIAAAYST